MNHKAGVRLQRTCIRISTVQFAKKPSMTPGQMIYLPQTFKGIVYPKMFAPPHVFSNMCEFLSSVEHNRKKTKIDDCCALGQWRERVKTCLNVLLLVEQQRMVSQSEHFVSLRRPHRTRVYCSSRACGCLRMQPLGCADWVREKSLVFSGRVTRRVRMSVFTVSIGLKLMFLFCSLHLN